MTREGKTRINVYLPNDLYSNVLKSEYNITEAIIKGLEKLLEHPREDFTAQTDTNTHDYSNSLNRELIQSLQNHIISLESQIMVKDEQLRNQAVHLQTVLTQKYITPPAKKREEPPSPKKQDKPEPIRDEKTVQKETTSKKNENNPAYRAEKTLLEKICKNCNQMFFTENKRKETCSGKCRVEYSRKKAMI
jgi:hypothetical protein